MTNIRKTNFHTHTYRCQHASGDVAAYCASAVWQGVEVLGISDHTPLPDGYWPEVRMSLAQLPGYHNAILQAQADFPQLTLLAGMECEYDPPYSAFYREVLLGKYALDYLVGGTHFFRYQGQRTETFSQANTPATLGAYVKHFIQAMESGLFAFMAHPDAFARGYLSWDENAAACSRDLCAAAAALQIPLEINGYGFRKPPIATPNGTRPMYPWPPFWEIAAEMGVVAMVNSDAHRPQDVWANIEDGLALAKKLNITVYTHLLT